MAIKVLDDDHSIFYNSDKRYDNVINITTQKAVSYIKEGLSLPRSKELFAHMKDSLSKQYPGAMSLITEKLGDIYKLCSLNEPLEAEFIKIYEENTSPMIEFEKPINMDEPYIIAEENDIIIR